MHPLFLFTLIEKYMLWNTCCYVQLADFRVLPAITEECSFWDWSLKYMSQELTSLVYETHIGYLGTLPALIGPNQDLKNYVPVNWEYICSLSYGDTLSLFTLGIISASHRQIWIGTGDLQRLDINYLSTPTWTLRRWGDTWGICTTSMRTGPLYEGTVFPCQRIVGAYDRPFCGFDFP